MKKDLYLLDMGQKTIAMAENLYPGTGVNNIGGLILVEDDMDFDLLNKALHKCVERNDALRLRIVSRKKKISVFGLMFANPIRQYFLDDVEFEPEFEDFSSRTDEEMEKALCEFNRIPINVYEQPPFQFKMVRDPHGRTGVFTKINHFAVDAWTSTLFASDLIDVYYAMKNGTELPPPLYSFRDYLEVIKSQPRSPQLKADKKYWLKHFKPPVKTACMDMTNTVSKTGESARLEVSLGAELSGRVDAFCKDNGVSPATFFEVLLGICVSKVSGSDDVSLLNLSLLRSTLKEKRTCGVMINSMLVRMRPQKDKGLLDLFKEVDDIRHEDMRHMRYPYVKTALSLSLRYRLTYFWDTMYAFRADQVRTKADVKVFSKWYPSGYFANAFSLYVSYDSDAASYNLMYEYQTEKFKPETAEDVHRSLLSYLTAGLGQPGVKIGDLEKRNVLLSHF